MEEMGMSEMGMLREYGLDDKEGVEFHNFSPDDFILIYFFSFIAAVVILVTAALHFLSLQLGYGDGLPFLIPAFFLYVCAEYFYHCGENCQTKESFEEELMR